MKWLAQGGIHQQCQFNYFFTSFREWKNNSCWLLHCFTPFLSHLLHILSHSHINIQNIHGDNMYAHTHTYSIDMGIFVSISVYIYIYFYVFSLYRSYIMEMEIAKISFIDLFFSTLNLKVLLHFKDIYFAFLRAYKTSKEFLWR